MLSRSAGRADSERGSVTAEFVVALPAALIVIVTALAGVQLGTTALRLSDATAVASRSIARGDTVALATARASGLVSGVTLTVEHGDDLVCVAASARGSGLLAQAPVTARSCALAGPRP